ncbi:MAG TPA: peptidoglycan DD-metalloendopeptidase family protein, partial [Nitrososphaera sp.]|nr:peptidoglycan DD-metalloendopeptidase family protein [Nitrososphaera sp.]
MSNKLVRTGSEIMQRLKASHRNLVAILLLLCFTAILTVIPSLDNPVIAANSDGFDYPISNVDRPTRTWGDSDGWYVSNDFGNYLSGSPCSAHYHPGDDWNKDNGVDAGETVRAVSNGKVESIRTLTNSLGTALGQGIGISHVLPDGSTVYSVYVHVNVNSSMFVGKTVTRGDPIATIYNLSSGPHLHFEMRTSFNPGDWYPGDDGCGYYYSYDAVISHGFIDPVAFLDSHRSLASCNNGSSESYRINGGPPLHPHGTLIKVNGNSTVYLIWNGQKRGITSESVLSNLYQQSNSNFKGSVITVAADELSSYPDGQVISSALPSNGRGQPDGRLIKNSAGEISIVTDNGRRRPFSSGTVFTQLGYSFCNAVLASDYDSYPVGSIVEGREALPTITSSITLSPSSPYNVGQSITAAFSITNRGNTSITFSRLLAGGRLNGSTITDFPTHSNITLTPNQSYYYQSSRSFANAGSYQFFPAFQTQDSIWRLSLNNEIGVAPGVVSVISATVDAGTKPTTTTNFASNVASTTAQLNGTVNPNGSATYIWFEWGTGSTLSSFNSTPQQSVGSGNTSLNVSATLTGLASGANYFYRLAASNSSGTSRGSILSFTTTAPNNIQVTIQTSPAGRSFTVDGTAYASAQTFTWTSGSSHSIGTTSPQNGATGTRYV